MENEKHITAEKFFKNKLTELYPYQFQITLSKQMITAEQGLIWAQEYYESRTTAQLSKHICIQTGSPCGFPCFHECPIYKEQ